MEAKGSLITINIDGKPLEKLLEVVSDGIGTLYRPRKIRREADAQAYAIKVMEQAKAVARAEAKMIDAETAERIGHRLVAQEMRRQNNIDSVVEATAEELRGKDVSDEHVDIDWATRFFGIVQDVSDEEMRALWAKILAREIEKPRSFSIRTLNVVSMLSRIEAEVIGKMSQFVLYGLNRRDAYILNSRTIEDVKFGEVMLLMELGLLDSASNLAIMLEKNEVDENNLLLMKNGTGLFIGTDRKQLFVDVYKFTNLGREIMQLADGADLNVKYVQEYAENLTKGDETMRVTCAPILKLVDNDVELDEENAYFKIEGKRDFQE